MPVYWLNIEMKKPCEVDRDSCCGTFYSAYTFGYFLSNAPLVLLRLLACFLERQGCYLSLISWHLGKLRSVSERLNMNTTIAIIGRPSNACKCLLPSIEIIFTAVHQSFTTGSLFIKELLRKYTKFELPTCYTIN